MNLNEKERCECIKKLFSKDIFMVSCGIEIVEVNREHSVCSFNVEKHHLNANDVVQGGMLYTLADIAYSTHANYVHPMTVTQVGNITYLKPAKCSKLVAEGKEISFSGHNAVGVVTIKNENDLVVAVANFNGFVKETPDEEYFKNI